MSQNPVPVNHRSSPDHHTYAGPAGRDDKVDDIPMSRAATEGTRYLPTAGRLTIRQHKGQKRVTYVVLERTRHTDHGIA